MNNEFDQIIQQVKDAMAVTASMALRHDERVKEHQQWLEDHERVFAHHQTAWVRHEKWLEDHENASARHETWLEEQEQWRERHNRAMEELDRKLDRIAELILKGRSGNGSGA